MNNQPPKLFHRFLRWFCHPKLIKPIEGDLLELYEERIKTLGRRKADRMFRKDVVMLFRKDIIKPASGTYRLTNYGMLKHNIILALRSFKRFKTSFIINIIGLSSGMAAVFLIYLWISDELAMDRFHANGDRIYQVMQNINNPDEIWTMDNTQAYLADALKDEMPEVEMSVSVLPVGSYGDDGVIEYEDKQLKMREQYASDDFFEFFSFELLRGNPKEVLSMTENAVISEDFAEKLFGPDVDPVGKTISVLEGANKTSYTVSGVFKKLPKNSSMQFDVVFTMETFLDAHPHIRDWGNSDPSTYILLKDQADISMLAKRVKDFIATKKEGYRHTLFLQKFEEKYLNNRYEGGVPVGGRIQYVRLFSIIAGLVLIIACINFMNLSTARASRRLKEIGVKKAMGARRSSLISQHYVEAILMTGIAMMVAFFITGLALPFFNSLTGKYLELTPDLSLLPDILLIGLITALLSGSYPALYLSGFDAIKIFRGKISGSSSDLWARRGLVVFQFSISILLITAVIVISNQMDYIQNKNLGFTKERIIYFNVDGALEENQATFLDALRNETSIASAASFGHDLLGDVGTTSGVKWEGKGEDEFVQFGNLEVGFGLIETFQLELVAGRSYSQEYGNERSNIILNEKAIEIMGLEDPIGKTINLWRRDRVIVGVIKDFHFKSLHEEISPCFFQVDDKALSSIVVRMKQGNEMATISRIEEIYRSFNPGLPFTFKFFDQEYDALYKSEQQIAGLSKSFGLVAIIISCLGLFGLVAFTAEKRRKEISIRKILGSSEFNLVILLTSDFSKMVGIAILVALPVSNYLMQRWLESFAYSIGINAWYFVLPALIAFGVAWITMGFQTLNTAKSNPVDALKDE